MKQKKKKLFLLRSLNEQHAGRINNQIKVSDLKIGMILYSRRST